MEPWARKLIEDLDNEIAARFEDKHGDPFDRMISAQAIQHHLPVLSTDPKLDAFGIRRLKDRSHR
jgi:PIN domain nuclease of toxin-antitoxin system